jgi:hypothetical protein
MFFRVGATFEMRTVLYKISLFNDQVEVHDWVLYQKQLCRERARQGREREKERVGDRALLETKDSIGNKIDSLRKYLWQMCEINLS